MVYKSSDNEDAVDLTDGHAVCYEYDNKIYGWRGKHIGWFIDGIIYDNSVCMVGCLFRQY
ncbi:MAG: 4-fold beta flower protein [Bacteroidota bacterium]